MDPAFFPVISLPLFIALLGLYALLNEESERKRLEELAERLGGIYRREGRSSLNWRRIKRLPFSMHYALTKLDKGVKSLEYRHKIRGRRPAISLTDNKPILDNLEERIDKLEGLTAK
ncbi:MAG: hypothetical protein GKR89_03860 [Candidatus Latescibacteria bacterium]|nr:hypothetical protein [Candidatus Latescibacterota bacterium]